VVFIGVKMSPWDEWLLKQEFSWGLAHYVRNIVEYGYKVHFDVLQRFGVIIYGRKG
jgi:hypothetical protein